MAKIEDRTKFLVKDEQHGYQWALDAKPDQILARALFEGDYPLPSYIEVLQDGLSSERFLNLSGNYESTLIQSIPESHFKREKFSATEIADTKQMFAGRLPV